jgi:hypothetical protein
LQTEPVITGYEGDFVGIPPEGLGSIVEGLHIQIVWHVSGSASFTGSDVLFSGWDVSPTTGYSQALLLMLLW